VPEQALYLKWRPLSFADVIGQGHITRTLQNSLKTGRIRHAYLFSGPRGTGKTTCARLLAKAVNCVNEDAGIRPCNDCPACIAVNEARYLDLIEIDAATHTGVDDVRDLREKIAFTPGEGRYKVYIIDEVHRFSGSAFDALLKTLEEPPEHAIFVLATTEIDKVPPTIKSRCLQFEFRRVSMMEVADLLQIITENEGLKIDRDALELIARQGTGSVRDSISLLDQIASDPDEEITLEVAQRILGTANTQAVKALINALMDENVGHGLHVINEAIDSGSDPRQFGQQVVESLRAVMLTQTAGAELVEASSDDKQLFEQQAQSISRQKLMQAIRYFNEAVNEYRGGWQPQLTLELALIESVHGRESDATVIVQQQQTSSSAPAVAKPEEPEHHVPETPAGSPPIIAPETIKQQWGQMLKALYRRNKAAPDVIKAYRVHHVDGNLVYLCTDDDFLFDRLYNEAEKLAIIERGLHDVHKLPLRVQVMKVEDINQFSSTGDVDLDEIEDPLLRYGVEELGGQIKPEDDEE
jgi:DNA polymerase III subunit gamma/tau